ncbi:MAG: hypothetical protein V4502_06140 [Pseudomonadota bacterium]
MTIEIVIRREASGILRANVLQHGYLGANLLRGRSIHTLESAKMVARGKLLEKLGYSVSIEIVWTERV